MRKLDRLLLLSFMLVSFAAVLAITVAVGVNSVIDWREHQQYMQSQMCEVTVNETVLQP